MFGGSLGDAIRLAGYPSGCAVPRSAEHLSWYGLDELEGRQVGYRIDGRAGAAAPEWEADRGVLADRAADPVTIGGDGVIASARHGRGGWAYVRIAPDLRRSSASWRAGCASSPITPGPLFDDEFTVPPATRGRIRTEVLAGLDPADRDAALTFLIG